MRKETKVFLNTWGAYNNGCIGYGWMTPTEAREFMEEDDERDGGEWFIADIDNYLGVEFTNLNYCNVEDVLDTIEELESLNDYEVDEIVALMEYLNTDSAQEALDQKDNYSFYSDIDSFYECMDELVECEKGSEFLLRYFDFEAYHRDCDFDIFEASNGVCIQG